MTDRARYFDFTTRSRLDKAINTLLGIVEGIGIDGVIKPLEREYLDAWLAEHRDAKDRHPFNELVPVVVDATADGRLADEERKDLQWLCSRLRSTEYYDRTSADMQRLHALLGAVAADGEILAAELHALRDWLDAHEHMRTLWPYDEVSALITGVLADGRIDPAEHALVLAWFRSLSAARVQAGDAQAELAAIPPLSGICAACPEIQFAGMRFCFTGESSRCSREELAAAVVRLGGTVTTAVSGQTNFLVVGADGNPCWSYACYGRKIEKAMELRREGARVVIVHENDFHDAMADHAPPTR